MPYGADSLTIRAYAKINLTLDIAGKRADGYHDLSTVFQPISLCDLVTITKTCEDGLFFSCTEETLDGPDNLVCKAYEAMKAAYHLPGGARIHLEKKIPSGAGLGGGSADAAAVIRGINALWDLRLSLGEMIAIGTGIGADVPVLIYLRAAKGAGIGEQLAEIPGRFSFPITIYKPDVSYETGAMYRRLDVLGEEMLHLSREAIEGTALVTAGLTEHDLGKVLRGAHNVFEKAVPDPQLFKKQQEMLASCGFEKAVMTGSGSAFFCLCRSETRLTEATAELRKRCGEKEQVFSCSTVSPGWEINLDSQPGAQSWTTTWK